MSHPSCIDPDLAKALIGKKIIGVNSTDYFGFNAPVLIVEGEGVRPTRIVILSDEEGNDSGVLDFLPTEAKLLLKARKNA